MGSGKTGFGNFLMVGDAPKSLEQLKAILAGLASDVRVAADGGMAFKAIGQFPPDLVLIDTTAPSIDGYEICRRIKAEKIADEIPILMIRAQDAPESPEMDGATSMVDCITLPFRRGEVLARLQAHLKIGHLQKKIRERNIALEDELAKHHRSEERRQESETLFRSLLEASPDPIVTYNPGGQTEFINSAFQKLYGWTLEELHRKPIDFVPADEVENTRKGWERTLAGENYQFETKRLTKNNELLHIELHTAILRNSDGAHRASIVIHRDITKKKQAEKLLIKYQEHLEELVAERTEALKMTNLELKQEITERKRAETAIAAEKVKLGEALQQMSLMRLYLKNIIDSMPSVIVGVDRNGRITHWNRQAEELAGIPADAACGKPLPAVFSGLDLKLENVRTAIGQKMAEKMEKVAFQWRGETRLADITIYPLVTDDVEGAVIRVDDVTARVRIEEMMVQNEKMLSLGGLAAGMAHEINNPLSGILQSLQNIQIRLSPDHPLNRRAAQACGVDLAALGAYLADRGINRFLEAIREAGAKAAEIVENMLNFTRKSKSEMGRVDLSPIINSAIELAAHDYDLKKKYDFRKIAIVRRYGPGLPQVRCIKTEIEQVVLNLLRNAAQAMTNYTAEDQPKIIISLVREERMICMRVKDNGPGMEEPVRRRMFEPFFTTKSVGVGSGLGLSVSYFIITRHHGGTMTVRSEPGKGTCFTVRLPIGGRSE